MIGGPAGLLVWTVSGAVIGGVAGKHLGQPIAKGDLKEIGELLKSNSSAILFLLEETQAAGLVSTIQDYPAQVVVLTVGEEISEQIVSYKSETE